MRMMVSLRALKCLAWLVASITAVPYLSVAALAARLENVPVQSMVLFPLDTDDNAANTQIAADLNAFLKDGFSMQGKYRVVVYSERLPAVRRLVSLQPDKKGITAGPFSTDSVALGRAVALGKVMLADMLVVGSVDRYEFNQDRGTALIAINAQVLDGKTGKPVPPRIVVTGSAAKPADMEGVNEATIRQEAVKDAGRKLIKEITGEEYQAPVVPVITKKKSSKKSWIPMLLLSLGVGLLLGGSGGGTTDGGSVPNGGTEPPPPPPF